MVGPKGKNARRSKQAAFVPFLCSISVESLDDPNLIAQVLGGQEAKEE